MKKCQLCNNSGGRSFYDSAGKMYDMPIVYLNFETVCDICWHNLAVAKSDLTTIAVQYHRNYTKNYKEFLKSNVQLDDNEFYRSNPIFRNGLPVKVGDRRKEIEQMYGTSR